MSERVPLGVVHYRQDDAADPLFEAFALTLLETGHKIAGCIQINGEKRCEDKQMALRDLTSNRLVNICQDLGPGAGSSCRINPEAVSEVAGLMRQGMSGPLDLVIINKFGKLESEGGGLLDEIGAAIASGNPLLIGVSSKFRPAWEAYAGDLGDSVGCSLPDMRAWWNRIRA